MTVGSTGNTGPLDLSQYQRQLQRFDNKQTDGSDGADGKLSVDELSEVTQEDLTSSGLSQDDADSLLAAVAAHRESASFNPNEAVAIINRIREGGESPDVDSIPERETTPVETEEGVMQFATVDINSPPRSGFRRATHLQNTRHTLQGTRLASHATNALSDITTDKLPRVERELALVNERLAQYQASAPDTPGRDEAILVLTQAQSRLQESVSAYTTLQTQLQGIIDNPGDESVAQLQRTLIAEPFGADLGTFGENNDGVDGAYGDHTDGALWEVAQNHDVDVMKEADLDALLTTPGPEPAVDADADPVTDADADPVTDADADPVTDADADPVTDADADPVTDADADPVTDADADPVTETEIERRPPSPAAQDAADDLRAYVRGDRDSDEVREAIHDILREYDITFSELVNAMDYGSDSPRTARDVAKYLITDDDEGHDMLRDMLEDAHPEVQRNLMSNIIRNDDGELTDFMESLSPSLQSSVLDAISDSDTSTMVEKLFDDGGSGRDVVSTLWHTGISRDAILNGVTATNNRHSDDFIHEHAADITQNPTVARETVTPENAVNVTRALYTGSYDEDDQRAVRSLFINSPPETRQVMMNYMLNENADRMYETLRLGGGEAIGDALTTRGPNVTGKTFARKMGEFEPGSSKATFMAEVFDHASPEVQTSMVNHWVRNREDSSLGAIFRGISDETLKGIVENPTSRTAMFNAAERMEDNNARELLRRLNELRMEELGRENNDASYLAILDASVTQVSTFIGD